MELQKPIVVFMIKTIFDSWKGLIPSNIVKTFTSPKVNKLKVVYMEVKATLGIKISLAIRAILDSLSFKKLYNNNITFVPQYKFTQNME